MLGDRLALEPARILHQKLAAVTCVLHGPRCKLTFREKVNNPEGAIGLCIMLCVCVCVSVCAPVSALPTQASPTLIATLQAQVMPEQGFKTWHGWGFDPLNGRALGNVKAGWHTSDKAEIDAHTGMVTLRQAASALAADFPPGFPQQSSGQVEPQQQPISALPHPPPGLGDHYEQERPPALPHLPPELVDPPQQEALPHLPPGLVAAPLQQQQPAAAGQPHADLHTRRRERKDEIDGDFFYRNKLAFPRYTQLRLHSNATFDWVGGGGDEEQERLQEERQARWRQRQADRFWKKQDVWDHSGFEEVMSYWGGLAPAIPGPEVAPVSPSSQHSALPDDAWGDHAPAIPAPVAAPASPSLQHSLLLHDAWGDHAPAILAPVAAASAEHADQLGDAWGVDAPAIPGPEASLPTLSAAHAGAALLPDDIAADQVTDLNAKVIAAANRRGRPRQCARSRRGNSSQAGTATPSQSRNSTPLLSGHAQQGVQHPLEYAWAGVPPHLQSPAQEHQSLYICRCSPSLRAIWSHAGRDSLPPACGHAHEDRSAACPGTSFATLSDLCGVCSTGLLQ